MKKLQKLAVIVPTAAALMLTALCLCASAERDGPFKEGLYTYYQENGETILTDFDCHNIEEMLDVAVPDEMGGCPVTVIGRGCFYNGIKVQSLVLPETLRSIEESAFVNCSHLTELKIPEGVKTIGDEAFDSCRALVSIDLGKVEKIGAEAFNDCDSLETLVLPDTVTELGNRCIDQLIGLKTLVVGDGLADIGGIVTNLGIESVTLGRSVTSIPDRFLNRRENLRELKLLGPVTYIGNEALAGTGLGTIAIPDTVEVIGDDAFTGLTVENLPSALRRVGANAFVKMDLAGAACPESLEYVGQRAFCACTGLENFDLSRVKTIDYDAFKGSDIGSQSLDSAVSVGSDAFSNCRNLKELTLGESLERVDNAFRDDSFDSVTLLCGDGVLGSYTFQNSTCERTVIGDLMTSVYGIILGRETVFGAGISFVPSSYNYIVEKMELRGSMELRKNDFSDMQVLKELKITGDVTSIESGAFDGCDSLKSVEMRTTLTELPAGAFYSSNAERIGNITSIGESAFNLCSSLKELSISGEITAVGKYAFYYCRNLKTFPDLTHITEVPEGMFMGSAIEEIVLPRRMDSIGDKAFSDCENLRRVVLPENIRFFGNSAFSDCSALSDINLPDTIVELGGYAFSGCSSITGPVKLARGMTYVPDYAFDGCASLTSVEIPFTVKNIGSGAFRGCASVSGFDLPDGLEFIGNEAFADCTGIKEFVLPDGIAWLNGRALAGCSSLKSLTLSPALQTIDEAALKGCAALEHVELPKTLSRIDNEAFMDCTSLKEIDLPSGLGYLGDFAFRNCTSLITVALPAEMYLSPMGVFAGCTSLTSVEAAPDDTGLRTVDGVLYNSRGGLSVYPAGLAAEEFTVPDDVVYIGEYAFDSAKLDRLYISGVEKIYTNAFNNSGLTVYADADAPCAQQLRNMMNQHSVDCFFMNSGEANRGVIFGKYSRDDNGIVSVSVVNDSGAVFTDGVLYMAHYDRRGNLIRAERKECGSIENLDKAVFTFDCTEEEPWNYKIFLWDDTMWPLTKPLKL